MKFRIISVAILSILLVACDSDDDDDTLVVDVFAEGSYSIDAPSTTLFSTDGGACNDATGTINVSEGVISGMVGTESLAFEVTGTVDSEGVVEGGGFALNEDTVADFDGQFVGEAGSGTWADNFGCEGTWDASLITE